MRLRALSVYQVVLDDGGGVDVAATHGPRRRALAGGAIETPSRHAGATLEPVVVRIAASTVDDVQRIGVARAGRPVGGAAVG